MTCILAAVAGVAGSASGALVFSNITISGSVAGTPTITPGVDEIDFAWSFPHATVGDPVAPVRAGNIVITFDVDSTEAITGDIASLLGVTAGSGTIFFNEVIEDRTPGNVGVIATANLVANQQNGLPRVANIVFDRPTFSFKVKKTIFLIASDSQAPLDIAQLGLLEQRFVPTPGSLALLGLAGLAAIRRRR